MKIAIDARHIVCDSNRRGIGKSVVFLLQTLARLKPNWEFLMLISGGMIINNPFHTFKNVKIIKMPSFSSFGIWRFELWDKYFLQLTAYILKAKLVFYPAHFDYKSTFTLVPCIGIIHDLLPAEEMRQVEDNEAISKIMHPDEKKKLKGWSENIIYTAKKLYANSKIVITDSNHTKKKLEIMLNFSPRIIRTIYLSGNSYYSKVVDLKLITKTKKLYGLKANDKYILSFGSANARKNLEGIIRCFLKLPKNIKEQTAIIFVGVVEPYLSHLKNVIKILEIESCCHIHEYISDEDIPILMSGASVLCYASFNEGFGIPILDAFRCETPVITSNCTSMPEIAGNAALYVDPSNIDDIANKLQMVLSNPSLQEDLIQKGRERLKHFSWEKCAKEYIKVFEEVANG